MTGRRRTVAGVVFESEGDGRWHPVDHPHLHVERDDEFLTECDNPHPGCPGFQPHNYTRWGVWDDTEDDFAYASGPGEFATFTEAAEWLARLVT